MMNLWGICLPVIKFCIRTWQKVFYELDRFTLLDDRCLHRSLWLHFCVSVFASSCLHVFAQNLQWYCHYMTRLVITRKSGSGQIPCIGNAHELIRGNAIPVPRGSDMASFAAIDWTLQSYLQ